MHVPNLRSPYDQVEGLIYFGRMLDKIKLKQAGKLPEDYVANLGGGFDERAASFLGVSYNDIAEQVKAGGTDVEILHWCYQKGRKPTAEDIEIWNEFMRKRGWNDVASERLKERKDEGGFGDRAEIQTFFDYIVADER